MPELRQNPATKEWVIIATERAKRPEELGAGNQPIASSEQDGCPFCPGNEGKTPKEVLSYRSFDTKPGEPGWWIRIIPNKFAALEPAGDLTRIKQVDFFTSMAGVGEHEVLIESPNHNLILATMEQKQAEEIFLAYRERYKTLSQDKRFEMVIIFKNHGVKAGTSLKHPHSQLIATPVTPMHIRHRIEEAMRYFDDSGKCVYCTMIEKEKEAKTRIVIETDNFIVFEPFAAISPFETWVVPKKHNSTFDNICPDQCRELAFVMRQTMIKIYRTLNNPDYNFMIFSAPCHERDLEYYHWHIQIVPRVTAVAGFEMGSGIYINAVPPETAAKYLRVVSME
jgi:UDPglucose--hexose-1-phosphate uridylyltransferase